MKNLDKKELILELMTLCYDHATIDKVEEREKEILRRITEGEKAIELLKSLKEEILKSPNIEKSTEEKVSIISKVLLSIKNQ